MTLRADHAAGAFFVAFGLLVFAISTDLPFGNLSLPGSGFLPFILAALTILFGVVLMVRAGESKPFATLSWHDAIHAALVVAITAVAIYLFERLGFLTTNILMMFGCLNLRYASTSLIASLTPSCPEVTRIFLSA